MRIMMLAQFYPPIIGGEERHVRNLSQGLVARGHEVAVVTLWHAGLPTTEVDGGVRVYRIRALAQQLPWLFSEGGRRHASPWADPVTTRAIAAILRRERPDVVHAHNWLLASYLPLARQTSARLVLTLHDYSQVCAKKNLLLPDEALCTGPALAKCLSCATKHYGQLKGRPVVLAQRHMRRQAMRAVDMFLPVSHAVAIGNQLAAHDLPYQVIPNFIPGDSAAQGTPDHPLLAELPDGPFILYVGDLSRQKGVQVLLRAYAGLTAAPPLVLIGRPFADTPTDLPAGARVLHEWPHGAIIAAWQRCTFGVVPSIWADPCPTVALEAMSVGKAVIASRIGGLPDQIVDGTTGTLVAPGDVIAWQTALQTALADPTRYAQMGQNARQAVQQFTAPTVIPAIEDVYLRLHQKGRAV